MLSLSYQQKVNADLTDTPDPAVLGEELDKLVHLEVEAGDKANDQQVVKEDVDKDDGSNDCVGQVKMKLQGIKRLLCPDFNFCYDSALRVLMSSCPSVIKMKFFGFIIRIPSFSFMVVHGIFTRVFIVHE